MFLAHRRFRRTRRPRPSCRAWLAESLEPRTLLAIGPMGTEFGVTTFGEDARFDHTVAAGAGPGGESVVAWNGGTGWGAPILIRRYGLDGVPLGSPFRVNPVTDARSDTDPAVAVGADGSFLVAWHTTAQGVPNTSIYARAFDRLGQPLGGDFRVSATTPGSCADPCVAAADDGGFVIAWQRGTSDGGYDSDVYARRYTASGEPDGGEFRVNATTAGVHSRPAVAAGTDGGFVVAWRGDWQQDYGDHGVYARRFDAAGQPLGADVRVTAAVVVGPFATAVASDADGAFVVAWAGYGEDGTGGIYARRYDAIAQPLGDPFRVSPADVTPAGLGPRAGPAVAADADGDFVVAWAGYAADGSHWDVFARGYDASGHAVTGAVRANTTSAGGHATPAVAGSAAAGFVVAWWGFTPQGTGWRYDVSAQRYRQFSDPASVGGVVWNDLDGDGVRSAGEPGVGGAAVRLLTAAGPMADGATTSDDGSYRFDSVRPGESYALQFVLPAAFLSFTDADRGDDSRDSDADPETGRTSPFTLAADQVDLSRGAGLVAPVSISGTKFNDRDGDGSRDPGEEGLEGWVVHLDADADRRLDPGEASMATDANGAYRFDRLRPGAYRAAEVGQDKWQRTAPAAGFHDLVLAPGQDATANFAAHAAAPDPFAGPIGAEFQVNARPWVGSVAKPAIAIAADGGFVAAWEATSTAAPGSGTGAIYARRFDGSGQPVGDEFRVSTAEGDRRSPAIAGAPGGGFVVAWESRNTASGEWDVYARRYDLAGALGDEFLVNTTVAYDQAEPAIAVDSDGDFVLVWSSRNPRSGTSYGIYAQRYDAVGRAVGGEFQIDAPATLFEDQYAPAIATGAGGGFIATWMSGDILHESDFDVYARRYDGAGEPLGGEFVVNVNTNDAQLLPSVSASPVGGTFVVVWSSDRQDGSEWGVYGRRFNSAGNPLGGEFLINTTTTGDQLNPSVAADADGDFIVTWQSRESSLQAYGVYARRYSAAGIAAGDEFRVPNAAAAGHQSDPAVGSDADGNVVIAWTNAYSPGVFARRYSSTGDAVGEQFPVTTVARHSSPSLAAAGTGTFVAAWEVDGPDGSGNGVFARRYDADGRPLGGDFLVNTTTAGDQGAPSVAAPNGDLVVAWQSYGQSDSGWDVYARRFASDGRAIGGEFLVNLTTDGAQYAPSIAADANGDFVVTWTSHAGGGSGADVYARRFAATGEPLGGEFRVNTTTDGNQHSPSVAGDADGDFVVVWQDGDGPVAGSVYAQRFAATGQTLGGQLHVGTGASPAVAMDSDGDFVVAWNNATDYYSYSSDVHARRFDAAGVPQGAPVRVTRGAAGSAAPAVAMDEDGDYVVAWSGAEQTCGPCGYGYGYCDCWPASDIHARRYSAAGVPQGGEFRVSTSNDGVQFAPALAMDADGDFVVAWQSYGYGNNGLYARRYGDTPAPRVTGVFVGGTNWARGFRELMAAQGLGEARFGYTLTRDTPAPNPSTAGRVGYSPPAPLDILPWSTIDRVSVRFSEPVVAAGRHLSLPDLGGDYAVTGFEFDVATNTATWTLSRPLTGGRLTLSLDGGESGITDAVGLPLDGEPSDYPFASGDGAPGGDFHLAFDVLPGDADRDGAVLASDSSAVRRRFFAAAGDAAYSLFHDVTGDGAILADDFSAVKRRFFDTLTPAPPVPAAAMSPPRARPSSRDLFAAAPVIA